MSRHITTATWDDAPHLTAKMRDLRIWWSEGVWSPQLSSPNIPRLERLLIKAARTLYIVGAAFRTERIKLRAALLTYVSLLSLVPALVVMFSVLTVFQGLAGMQFLRLAQGQKAIKITGGLVARRRVFRVLLAGADDNRHAFFVGGRRIGRERGRRQQQGHGRHRIFRGGGMEVVTGHRQSQTCITFAQAVGVQQVADHLLKLALPQGERNRERLRRTPTGAAPPGCGYTRSRIERPRLRSMR